MTDPENKPPAPEEPKPKELEEIGRLKDQLLRLQADFENARKRWLKQQAEVQEMANAELIRELLEIYDDFQRALEAKTSDPNQFISGIEMISRRMEDFLKSYGVEPMDAVGKTFDVSRHEAVAHEATAEVPESTVLSELRKGYVMNGKVLRPAIVKVATAPADPKIKEA